VNNGENEAQRGLSDRVLPWVRVMRLKQASLLPWGLMLLVEGKCQQGHLKALRTGVLTKVVIPALNFPETVVIHPFHWLPERRALSRGRVTFMPERWESGHIEGLKSVIPAMWERVYNGENRPSLRLEVSFPHINVIKLIMLACPEEWKRGENPGLNPSGMWETGGIWWGFAHRRSPPVSISGLS